jgi:hypothetical protein
VRQRDRLEPQRHAVDGQEERAAARF